MSYRYSWKKSVRRSSAPIQTTKIMLLMMLHIIPTTINSFSPSDGTRPEHGGVFLHNSLLIGPGSTSSSAGARINGRDPSKAVVVVEPATKHDNNDNDDNDNDNDNDKQRTSTTTTLVSRSHRQTRHEPSQAPSSTSRAGGSLSQIHVHSTIEQAATSSSSFVCPGSHFVF